VFVISPIFTYDLAFSTRIREDINKINNKSKKCTEYSRTILKVTHYSQLAKKAWRLTDYHIERTIVYKDFKYMLDLLGIIIPEYRARRLFKECDLDCSRTLDRTEFEIALMMNNILIPDDNEVMSPVDVFILNDFDSDGLIDSDQFGHCVRTLGHCRSEKRLHCIISDVTRNGTKKISYDTFKRTWCLSLADCYSELKKRSICTHISVVSMISSLRSAGALSFKMKHGYMLLNAIDNRDKISSEAYKSAMEKAVKIRMEKIGKKDEIKRSKVKELASLSRFTKQEEACRKKKRIFLIKQEQKERAKARVEDRIAKEKLRDAQQKAKLDQERLISMSSKEKGEMRLKEIRTSGSNTLILKNRNMRHISEELYKGHESHVKLAQLVFLDLSGNQLKQLPELNFFFQLCTLRKLDISCNMLSWIPGELSNLKSLEVLRIDDNKLRALPHGIFSLSRLVHLDVSRNSIITLPDSFEGLRSLKIFVASFNCIEDLPPSITTMSSIKMIDLSCNNIGELPDEMCLLVNLVKADFHHNSITYLPDNIGFLSQLKYVDFSFNKIQASLDV